jgi:hypothetical protein
MFEELIKETEKEFEDKCFYIGKIRQRKEEVDYTEWHKCKTKLETLKQCQTIAAHTGVSSDEQNEKLDIINSKLDVLKDSTIDHVYSFFDRRINITEIQDRIKEDFKNFKQQLNPAQNQARDKK